MPKQRRVDSMLALAVLSAVIGKPMHPYEMASVLRGRGKEQDMKIKWGSLYTVVANLEKHGLLEVVDSEQRGRRPKRTIYQITDAGRDEMLDWVRELVGTPEREHPRFKAGLSVLAVLPPDEVTALLQQRLELLEPDIAGQREALAQYRHDIPRLFLIEAEYDLTLREAEVNWIRSLLDELSIGSFEGLAQWRAWHETGHATTETT